MFGSSVKQLLISRFYEVSVTFILLHGLLRIEGWKKFQIQPSSAYSSVLQAWKISTFTTCHMFHSMNKRHISNLECRNQKFEIRRHTIPAQNTFRQLSLHFNDRYGVQFVLGVNEWLLLIEQNWFDETDSNDTCIGGSQLPVALRPDVKLTMFADARSSKKVFLHIIVQYHRRQLNNRNR